MQTAFAPAPLRVHAPSRSAFLCASPAVPAAALPRRARARRRASPRMTAAAYPVPRGVSGECSKVTAACDSIPALLRSLAERYGDHVAVIDEHRTPDARARLTYGELDARIRRARTALARLGVRHGDVVALFAENSHRWLIADQAAMACGAACAVRGVEAPASELRYIYEHSGAKAIFVDNARVFDRVLESGLDTGRVDFVVSLFGPAASAPGVRAFAFDDLLAMGHSPAPAEERIQANTGDVAALLYTSGTTGSPKGVVLTHANLLHQAANICIGRIDPVPGEVFVSVLPCWHIFERTAAYFCMSKAMVVVYSNKRRFRDDLVKHRPHVLIAVPRVFENLHSAIMAKLKTASALRKKIFAVFVALSVAYIHAYRRLAALSLKHMSHEPRPSEALARAFSALRTLFLAPLYLLANLLVWRKIRAATGGRVRLCVCGGGLLAGHLEDFFECARIEICVGYGLTETSPVISNRFVHHNVRGSAGLPLPSTIIKIADQDTDVDLAAGEQGVIKVKGPQVFSRYLHNAEATTRAFDSEGFFDTGDLGYIGAAGDIVVTGRSKDVIVLSNGENVEPAPIEDAILASPLIDQVVLVGQDERALGALVVPRLDVMHESGVIDDELHARALALLQQQSAEEVTAVHDGAAQVRAFEHELGVHPTVFEKLSAEIAARNEARDNYSRVDRVAHFRVVLQPFTVENGMMTQTMKIKKQIVAAKLDDHIRSMYAR